MIGLEAFIFLFASLSFIPHIQYVTKSCYVCLYKIAKKQSFLSATSAEILLHTLVMSSIDYWNLLLFGLYWFISISSPLARPLLSKPFTSPFTFMPLLNPFSGFLTTLEPAQASFLSWPFLFPLLRYHLPFHSCPRPSPLPAPPPSSVLPLITLPQFSPLPPYLKKTFASISKAVARHYPHPSHWNLFNGGSSKVLDFI